MATGFKGATFAKQRRKVGNPVSPAAEHARFEPLPAYTGTGSDLVLMLDSILPGATADATKAGQLVFHTVGDTGGIHGTETQSAISDAMEAQITAAAKGKNAAQGDAPRFFYHLGDVVYFNGLSTQYVEQFYEPYQYYDAPIFAIPGNHDGDTQTRKGDEADNEPSLYGFMKNFCSATSQPFFKYRSTMTQPYCYWTLQAPFVHIIGTYSNVDGLLDARGSNPQLTWLVQQLQAAPKDKWVILGVHHPCYSLDSVHGGYEETLATLDRAFEMSGRAPDAVLSGHVHNTQRFSRKCDDKTIPYIIAGAGGYANTQRAMHPLQDGLDKAKRPYPTTVPGVALEFADDQNAGFLRVTANPTKLVFDYFSVSFDTPPKVASAPVDTVTVSAPKGTKMTP
ncbi:metallophosphoesterase [Paraburkholderia phosphatilytica]|uniref:metallophosphoesterase n=1 Tax=Paraburkholderia phosphatilytica TaxID=2282883 RepID=UPI0013DFCA44|nr:metallophosphoesterase [Paraburkholderia phosphatilytica]